MSEQITLPGKTTIAPDVLVTIAQLAATSVPGVKRLSPMPGGVQRLFKLGMNDDGVRITVEGEAVYTDVYVIIEQDAQVREVSRAIQSQVAHAISEMVGMEVGRVNVHVEDIDPGPVDQQVSA